MVLSIPVTLVFLNSEYVRFISFQVLTSWKGKVAGLSSVYVGDSITAGGKNWGSILSAINLAKDGYTVWQIEGLIDKAESYSPKSLYILAETNDIIRRRPFDLVQFEQDYRNLFDRAMKTKAKKYVTEIPYTSDKRHANDISAANLVIRRLASTRNISTIDLNPVMAPDNILLSKYIIDGVRFSEETYKVWRAQISALIDTKEEPIAAGDATR